MEEMLSQRGEAGVPSGRVRLRLFGKLLLTYLVVVVITVTTLGGASLYLVRGYFLQQREHLLLVQGRQIARGAAGYLAGGFPDRRTTQVILTFFGRVLEARVWLVDGTGQVILASPERHPVVGTMLPAKQTKGVLSGTAERFSGYDPLFGRPMLTVAVPVRSDRRVLGAVFLHTSFSPINTTVDRLRNLLLYSTLLAVGISTAMALYLSRRLARPLQEISAAALDMAKGNFDRRVQVDSADEVGQLAETFNYMAGELGKIAEAQRRLESMRREFVANVSHELRTPLTAMRGFLEALVDGMVKDPAGRRRYLAVSLEETLRLNRLVNDLLDLSRMESGQLAVDLEPMELDELLHRTVEKLEPLAAQREVLLAVAALPPLPQVLGDPDRVEQILINLVDNALRYTPPGGRVEVAAVPEGGMVRVSVRDTGMGIAPDELELIWDRFHKVDRSRARSGGTGLGLSIVKQLVGLHGGTVSAVSSPGEGSTFSFTLRRAEGFDSGDRRG